LKVDRAAVVVFYRNENCRCCGNSTALTLQLEEMGDLLKLMPGLSNHFTPASPFGLAVNSQLFAIRQRSWRRCSIDHIVASTCGSTHLGPRGPRGHPPSPHRHRYAAALSAASSTSTRGKLLDRTSGTAERYAPPATTPRERQDNFPSNLHQILSTPSHHFPMTSLSPLQRVFYTDRVVLCMVSRSKRAN
jgi:hypothetical protein